MNSNNKITGMEVKAKLSTLWILILFNVIIGDIHGFFKPGFIEEIMTGFVGGVQMTEELFLIAAIPMEIFIVMIFLSQVLIYTVNRWTNIIVGVIAITITIGNIITTEMTIGPDRIFFAIIEVVAMILIIRYAWRWSNTEISPNNKI